VSESYCLTEVVVLEQRMSFDRLCIEVSPDFFFALLNWAPEFNEEILSPDHIALILRLQAPK